MSEPVAAARHSERTRRALVLGGGGLQGAAWELGALAAIEDHFGCGSLFREFDIFVGTSAGSLVAALLAQGIPPGEICDGVVSGDPLYRVSRRSVYSIDVGRLGRALLGLATGLLREIVEDLKHRHMPTLLELSYSLQERLPAGFFRLEPLDRFLCRIFEARGISNRFADLRKELLVMALDLRTGQHVAFGGSAHSDPTICEAITASSAIPRLFGPVRIGEGFYVDGMIGGDAQADVAIERGANQMLILNPLVPTAPSPRGLSPGERFRWNGEGLGAVLNQCFRIAHATAFRCSLDRTSVLHQHVQMVLLEPHTDEKFSSNAMDPAVVPKVIQSARTSTARRIDEPALRLSTFFGAHHA